MTMMRLQVTADQASIEAARTAAIEGERTLIEGVFERIAAATAPETEEDSDEDSEFRMTRAEKGTLRRNRDQVVPRLLAIAQSRGEQDEWVRLSASTALGVVDRSCAFVCLTAMLDSKDARILSLA